MKKTARWIVIVLIVAALVAIKLIFFPGSDKGEVGKAKPQGPITVNYHVVKAGSLANEVFATGEVGAFNEVNLVAEAAGKVEEINFREGETVEKGRLMVKLNDRDLQAQLVKIRTQIKNSEQRLDRFKKLLEVNGVSKEEYETLENEVAGNKADESFVLAQIAKTSIIAPFTGVAGLRNVSPGAYVTANTPVASLVQMSPLYVEFSIPDKYAGLYRKGTDISFSNETALGTRTYSAEVYAVEPRVESGTRMLRARAMYRGRDTLYPGTFVKVRVELGEIKNALMVPSQCVVPVQNGQKVYRVQADSVAEQMVVIGIRDEKHVQIVSGISAGDTLVASGLLAVKNGSKVKLLKPVN